jgi:acetylornithine/N-succinyldiaminopimelate aminotransferase
MLTQRQLFLHHLAQTSPAPLLLEIVRAEGIYLYAADGTRYVDLISGISVSNVGHSHPDVVAAVQQQAASYMHLLVYGELVQSPQVRYAKALTDRLPASLNSVYFTNSGTEATEGAMKLAKRYTGSMEIIHFRNSYHGSTQGALSILGDEYFRQAYRPLLPGIRTLDYGEIAQLEDISHDTAAVILDPIQAESGVTIPSLAYMQALRARCTEVGAVLILDEAQTAMGRTGKLFAMEHYNIVPDVLLLAKAFGGGMPLGAFIADRAMTQVLTHDPVLGHITTFGGHPVCCAAGLATLGVLERDNLITQVEAKGQLIETLIQHPAIITFRRKGLMIAIEFASETINQNIIRIAITKGLMTDWFLFAPHCMRICPPLTITIAEIQDACVILLEAIAEGVTVENG